MAGQAQKRSPPLILADEHFTLGRGVGALRPCRQRSYWALGGFLRYILVFHTW